MATYQIIIGRAEELDLLGYALGVPAKIDTGAFRSSIHATGIKVVTVDGKEQLHFNILGHRCTPISRAVVSERFEKIKVRSSNGHESERYEVTFKVKVGPKIFNTSFSLADRANNVFPVLIGREALKKRFIVDPDKTSVSRTKLAEQFGFSLDGAEDLED